MHVCPAVCLRMQVYVKTESKTTSFPTVVGRIKVYLNRETNWVGADFYRNRESSFFDQGQLVNSRSRSTGFGQRRSIKKSAILLHQAPAIIDYPNDITSIIICRWCTVLLCQDTCVPGEARCAVPCYTNTQDRISHKMHQVMTNPVLKHWKFRDSLQFSALKRHKMLFNYSVLFLKMIACVGSTYF